MSKLLKSFALAMGTAALWLGSMAPVEAYAIYPTRAAWQAAVDAVAGSVTTTDTFSNPIGSAQSITLDSGIVSTNSIPPILPNAFNNNSVGVNTPGEYSNATGGGTASATITWAFPASIFAFGADFSSLNDPGVTLIGNFDGAGDQTIAISGAIGGSSGFLGVIGSSNFGSIVFGTNSTSVDAFAIDNASFAVGDLTVVPEPTTLALFGLGAVGMAARRRAA